MDEINNHNHNTIPPPPDQEINQQDMIKTLASLAKPANTQVRKITTKHTLDSIKKAISKYRQLYETSPKKINKKIFKNQETPPVDCIMDRNNNIPTNPENIANEIHIQ